MAMSETAEKPAYLGLLNAISLAESAAGQYLNAWADATTDEDLACCLRFVAARETSHGEVFCRRIAELGYSLKPKRDPEAGERLAKFADPRISDLEKIGPERAETGDIFRDIKKAMDDGAYDAMTCNLLQWYIAEEEDSGRRLREAYAAVREKANGGRKAKANGAANGHASADAEAIMACMTQGFSRLEKSIEKLAKAVR